MTPGSKNTYSKVFSLTRSSCIVKSFIRSILAPRVISRHVSSRSLRFQRQSREPASGAQRVFLECTQTFFGGGNSGIQRVTRNLVNQSQALDWGHVEVVPVAWAGDGFSRVTRPLRIRSHYIYKVYGLLYQLRRQGSPADEQQPAAGDGAGTGKPPTGLASAQAWLRQLIRPFLIRFIRANVGPPVRLRPNDIFILLDSTWGVPPMLDYVCAARQQLGVRVGAMVHDLFPLTHPDICELNTTRGYRSWFQRALPFCDFAITNSHSTRSILLSHLTSQPGLRSAPLPCAPFTLGATLDTIRPKKKDHGLLDQIWSTPGQAMLALGTIEPRKNYRSILDAYDVLRARGLDVSLIVIGKKGWMSDDVIARLTHHPDRGSRLIYLPNASDFVVANAFQRSDCLVCASLSEGFGLPLVEGMMHGCHVVASDIEVFREVGGDNCQFFSLHDPEDLPNQVEAWFRTQYSSDQKPDQAAPRWPDWSQSTREFLDRVLQLAAPDDVNSGSGKPY